MNNEPSPVIHEFKHESRRLLCRRIVGRYLMHNSHDRTHSDYGWPIPGTTPVALSYRELEDGRIVPVILTDRCDFVWKCGDNPVRVYDSVNELRYYHDSSRYWDDKFERHFGGLMHSNLCNGPYDWESPAA